MNVSKVVVIVVGLHVLVIGGIFVFEGCSRAKAPEPSLAANETAPDGQNPADMPALPAPQPVDATAQSMTPVAPTTGSTALAPATTVAPVAPAATAKTYVVKKGDSLWKIAQSEKVTMSEIAKANNITKTSALKIGQKLNIPSAMAKATPTTATASVLPVSSTTGGIASSIPTATTDSTGAGYTVKSGDSLWKIAKANNTSVTAIKQANNLASDSLKVGQKLTIPSGTAHAATAVASATSEWTPGPVTENNQQYHIVDIGESPAVIAKKYGIKTEDLMKANNISNAKRIMVGDKLVIPTAQPLTSTSAKPAMAAPVTPAATPAPASATPATVAPIVSAN